MIVLHAPRPLWETGTIPGRLTTPYPFLTDWGLWCNHAAVEEVSQSTGTEVRRQALGFRVAGGRLCEVIMQFGKRGYWAENDPIPSQGTLFPHSVAAVPALPCHVIPLRGPSGSGVMWCDL